MFETVIPYIKSEMKVINLMCVFNHLLQQVSLLTDWKFQAYFQTSQLETGF